MKVFNIIAIIGIFVITLVVKSSNGEDGLSKRILTVSARNHLQSLRIAAMQYANFGCIKLAEKNQNEYRDAIYKIRSEKLKDSTINERIMRFIQETEAQEQKLEAFIILRNKYIKIWKFQYQSMLHGDKEALQKKGLNETAIIKTFCKEVGLLDGQNKNNSIIFYLSNNLKEDTPKMILAGVVKEIISKNRIKINLLYYFDKNKVDIIELNMNKHNNIIKLDKISSLKENLPKVMVHFFDTSPMQKNTNAGSSVKVVRTRGRVVRTRGRTCAIDFNDKFEQGPTSKGLTPFCK